jgi:hypothetical protein
VGVLVVWFVWVIGRTPETVLLPAAAAAGGLLPSAFDLLFFLTVIGSLLLTAWTVFRLVRVWRVLRPCLEAIEETPIAGAMGRLGAIMRPMAQMTPFDVPSSQRVNRILDVAIHTRWTGLDALHSGSRRGCGATCKLRPARHGGGRELSIRSEGCEFNSGSAASSARSTARWCRGRRHGDVAADARGRARWSPWWRTRRPAQGGGSLAARGGGADRALRARLRGVESSATCATSPFYLIIALVLTTMLVSSYPFTPQSTVKGPFVLLLLGTVAGLVWVLVEMNRNPTLSRITGTSQGEVTWNARFVVNLLVVGVLRCSRS